jgi:hypothetical protein
MEKFKWIYCEFNRVLKIIRAINPMRLCILGSRNFTLDLSSRWKSRFEQCFSYKYLPLRAFKFSVKNFNAGNISFSTVLFLSVFAWYFRDGSGGKRLWIIVNHVWSRAFLSSDCLIYVQQQFNGWQMLIKASEILSFKPRWAFGGCETRFTFEFLWRVGMNNSWKFIWVEKEWQQVFN